jgi:hypothetical protein
MRGNVARDQCRADFFGFKRRLFMQRAHPHTLLIAQYGEIYRAGDVILGKFGRGAHIDDDIKFMQLLHACQS